MSAAPTDDLRPLLAFLSGDVATGIKEAEGHLEEVKIRYGMPLGLLLDGRWTFRHDIRVSQTHLTNIVAKAQYFRDDNRRGIDGTGHRLSVLRGGDGTIAGLTVRVGRFLSGVAEPLRPFLDEDPSMLVIGLPGQGKTTLLRDVVRLLGERYALSCVVVDTSNEITGDGREIHPALGLIDRLQVPSKAAQAGVIFEAVRNHSPRVLVVDEIGYADDAQVLATAATKGPRVVASAHGATLLDVRRDALLAPVLSPPAFRWAVLLPARGVYHVHDLPLALAALERGETPKPQEVRVP